MWGLFSSSNFKILTVCTGNIWRSPSAEVLLAHALGHEAKVSSAGTSTVNGEPIDYGAELRLRRRGLSAADVKSRKLSSRTVRAQDLVLALNHEHREHVLSLRGARPERTFTLLELARVVDSPGFPVLPKGSVRRRLAALVRLAHEHRYLGAGDDGLDVPDPFGKPPPVMDESFRLIVEAVGVIAKVVCARTESGVAGLK